MKAARALLGRELRACFDVPLGWLVLAALLATFGFFHFFVHDALGQGVASLRGLFRSAPLVLAIFTPLVTMRLLAEERATGTWELLATLPIPDGQIVAGKFAAGLAVVLLGCAGTLGHAATIAALGDLDPGPVLGGYLGMALVAAAYTAVGLLCSAASNSTIVAALSGLLACFGLWVVDKLALRVPGEAGRWLAWVGVDGHAANLERGVLDSRDLVYFAVLVALALSATAWTLTRQRLGAGTVGATARGNAGIRIVLLTVVCGCAVALSAASWRRTDLSRGGENTLSDGARAVLGSLDGPVTVEVFLSRDLPAQFARYTQRLRDTLDEFAAASPVPFEVRFTDPTDDEAAQARARSLGVVPRETSARSRGKLETQVTWLGLSMHGAGREASLPFVESVALLEYELARMLRELEGGGDKAVLAVVTGQGEPDLVAAMTEERHPLRPVAEALSEDYSLRAVDLSKEAELPGDATVALVLGSQQPLSPAALRALASFVQRGGGLALFPLAALPNPETRQVGPAPVDFSTLVAPWGAAFGDGLVVQRGLNGTIRLPLTVRTPQGPRTIQQSVSSPLVPIVTRLDREHPVTRRLQSIVAPFARPIEAPSPPPGVVATALAITAPEAAISADVASLDPRALAVVGDDEVPGPRAVLLALQGPLPGPGGTSPEGTRVLIGGSFEMPLASPGLLLAGVDWLAADEQLLSIRPRLGAPALIELPPGRAADVLPLGNTLGPPVGVLLLGFARLRWRRRR